MDADLAFCLERFADEQMAENIEQIARFERKLNIKSNELEGTLKYNDVKAYHRENSFVKQLSSDLKEKEISIAKTRKTIEIEFREALDRTLADIDTIVQIAATTKSNREVDEALRVASNKIRRQIAQIDNEVTHLTNTIDANISFNCSTRSTTWLKQHYGYVAELGYMVGKDSSFVDQLAFSEKGPLVHCLIEPLRIWDDRQRLISNFAKQIEEDEVESDYLIDSLSRIKSTDKILEFVHSYMQVRQAERRQQQGELLRQMELELQQQRVEQQTRALEMASAIYQLSVGSTNATQFDKRLKQVLNRSRVSKQFIPCLIGHVEEASVKALPFIFHLEADFNQWSTNAGSIQQQFCSSLCKTMHLPVDALRIDRIEQGSVILHLVIHPPHGQLVVEQISGRERHDPLSPLDVEAIQECCEKFDSRIHSIVLGTYGLTIEKRLMDFKWNKRYFNRHGETGATYWPGSLNRGGKPYFCPEGWTRFGVNVAESASDFDAKWGSWHIAYHGTRGSNAPLILASSLRASNRGCHITGKRPAVYLSPSIEYSAHPRYARPWKKPTDDDKKQRYYQLVFQCRINPNAVGNPKHETLLYNDKKFVRIDKNFRNEEIEWVIMADHATEEYIRNNIKCYGLMIRVIDGEPKDLPTSKW